MGAVGDPCVARQSSLVRHHCVITWKPLPFLLGRDIAMQSRAATVDEYLAELPEDRRREIEAVRAVILENLDSDYEEGMQYGMIGYYVPHRVYPAGYHCDPKQPLPFVCLASQKNYLSLYMMSVYSGDDQGRWFHEAWDKTGKKLDMGKSCIRFKRAEDLALDVIGEAVRRMPARKYLEQVEAARTSSSARRQPAKKSGGAKTAAKSKPAKKKKTTKAPRQRSGRAT
jgi:hypothetical protein